MVEGLNLVAKRAEQVHFRRAVHEEHPLAERKEGGLRGLGETRVFRADEDQGPYPPRYAALIRSSDKSSAAGARTWMRPVSST